MAMVHQDVILFGRTIKENIAYGKPDATIEEITAEFAHVTAKDGRPIRPNRPSTRRTVSSLWISLPEATSSQNAFIVFPPRFEGGNGVTRTQRVTRLRQHQRSMILSRF